MKSRFTKVTLEFVYVTDEPTESIPPALAPRPGHGINDFITAGLQALGVEGGEIAAGAKWGLTTMQGEPPAKKARVRR